MVMPYFYSMRFYIKNMVCNRCITAVRREFEAAGIQPVNITLGEVETAQEPASGQLKQLHNKLLHLGFELLDDSKQQLIGKIKNAVIEHVHYNASEQKHNFSDILSRKLHKDYSYISSLFSEVEGITIEKYIIRQKIEKVKELLIYDEMSLSEIAFQMGYSSVAHLSAQFKKVTGLTPSHFRQAGINNRKALDEI